MTHVVDRCPSCGLEHDHRVHECEACHTPVRSWCRRHGRDAGWLDGPACPRCVEEAVRPPRPAPARTPAAGTLAPVAPAVRAPVAWPGGRSPSEVLRGPPATPAPAAATAGEEHGPFGHGCVMLMMLLMTVTGGGLIGLVAGSPFIVAVGQEGVQWIALGGAALGFLFGAWCCVEYVREQRGKVLARRAAASPFGAGEGG